MRFNDAKDDRRRRVRAALGALSLLLVSSAADARIETLRWTHPDESSVLAFRIYVRSPDGSFAEAVFEGMPAKANGVFVHELDVPDGESIVVAVSAIGQADLESNLSNQQIRSTSGTIEVDLAGWVVLKGDEKVKTPQANTGWVDQDLTISYEDGVWTSLDRDGNVMSGTYKVKNTVPLKIVFKLDMPSRRQLVARLHARARELSGFAFTADPEKRPKLKLRLDDSETAGRIRAKIAIAEFGSDTLHVAEYIVDVDGDVSASSFGSAPPVQPPPPPVAPQPPDDPQRPPWIVGGS